MQDAGFFFSLMSFTAMPDARIWVIVLFCFTVMNKTSFIIQTSKTADVSPLSLKKLQRAEKT